MTNMIMYAGRTVAACFNSVPKWIAAGAGCLWAYLEPTYPIALLCVAAVLMDCVTAWRLNRRVRRAFPNANADGKLKSANMFKMIPDLGVVYGCILLANEVDNRLLGHWGDLHLGQYIAAIFVLCTMVSVLENESSCSKHKWARAIQKIVTNKVARHIDIDEKELNDYLSDDTSTGSATE